MQQEKVVKITINGINKTGSISDGYHTFDELYDHRDILFIGVCQLIVKSKPENPVWRSKKHHDGSMYEDQFIMGIHKEPGRQISYHMPLERWEETNFAETLESAPEWDKHTSDDVLERLKQLLW